jgi:pimeloyl-ACP methyl ester carboxylesterase
LQFNALRFECHDASLGFGFNATEIAMVRRFTGLAADVQGDRDDVAPLVMLHGLTFDRSMWRPVVAQPLLRDSKRRIMAFDLPGHGESEPQPSYAVDAVAATVHDAVTAAGAVEPVIVGHSVSGLVATFYAARYSTRGVVSVDQPLDVTVFAELVRSLEDRLRGPEFRDLWAMFEASFHVELLPGDAQELVRSMTRVRQDVVLGYWSQIFELPTVALNALVDDALAALRDKHVRYTYVSGSTVEPAYEAWLKARLPEVEIVSWPNSGHFPHLPQPEAFAKLVAGTAEW